MRREVTREAKRNEVPMTGISSLLVIFAVLCLTVFAVLSVSTVKADCSLADKMAESVTGYYEADCQAEVILAQIRQGKVPAGVMVQEDVYSWSCRVSETQVLEAEVRVTSGDVWEVLRWQTVSSVDWEADDSLHLWDGQ